MKLRFAVLDEGSRPRILKVPVNQSARLVNEYSDRKVEIFETLGGAKQAALALVDRIRANARPRITAISTEAEDEDEELRRSLSELSEDQVERFYF